MGKCTALLAIAAAMAAAAPASAQQPSSSGQRIGYVVAIVGDSAIFNSDLQEALYARQAQLRQPLPQPGPEYDRLVRELLEERVNELLLLQAAARDTTIRVRDDQILRAVQQDVEQRQRQAGGMAAFEQALRASGLTLQEYREMRQEQMKREALIEQYMSVQRRQRRSPPITEQEMRAAFEQMRAQVPERPASIAFQQIVVNVEPSADALAQTRQVADSLLARIRAGEDFAQVARRHSEDEGSREQGGDLGWFRRGDMVREFGDMAFAMAPGQVSPPVRTQHGLHIIKVERVRGGVEVQARHILLRPEITDADALRARARADTVAERLRAGADATELQRQYGDRDQPLRGLEVADEMQSRYGVDIGDAQAGAVLGPIPIGGEDIARQFLVLRVTERQPARPWTLEDAEMRERVRNTVEFQKLFAEIIADLRRATYVEIRAT